MLGSRHVILVPILHVLHLREPEATSWRQRWTRWSHSTGLETSGTGAKTPMGKISFQGGWTWITPPGRVDVMFLGVGKKKQHLVVVNEFRNCWFPSLVKNRNSFGYFRVCTSRLVRSVGIFFPEVGTIGWAEMWLRFSYGVVVLNDLLPCFTILRNQAVCCWTAFSRINSTICWLIIKINLRFFLEPSMTMT